MGKFGRGEFIISYSRALPQAQPMAQKRIERERDESKRGSVGHWFRSFSLLLFLSVSDSIPNPASEASSTSISNSRDIGPKFAKNHSQKQRALIKQGE